MKVTKMKLTSLVATLPKPFQLVMQPITRQPIMPTGLITCTHTEVQGSKMLIGIRRVETIKNPLRGKIFHFSTQKSAYHAALGRTVDGAIDFSDTHLIYSLKDIVSDRVKSHPGHAAALEKIAALRQLSVETLLRDIAECADDVEDVANTLLPGFVLLEVPTAIQVTVAWLQASLQNWRLHAFFDRRNCFHHLLDVHRFGEVIYSLSGTNPQSISIVNDEAVWIPTEELIDELDPHDRLSQSEKYSVTLDFCKRDLERYNAYLKQQVFSVVTFQLDTQSNEYVEIATSNPVFGFSAVSNLMRSLQTPENKQH